MKIARYLLTFSCFVVFSSHAQKNNKANERLFDEFTASLNLTTSTTTYFPQGMHNRFGVGIGAYHGFRRGNIFTPLFGIELNYTAQYYDIMDVSESEQKRDLNIRGLNFSLPIDFRFNSLGKKKQFFIQTGVFVDFNFLEQEKGYDYFYLPTKIAITDTTHGGPTLEKINNTYFSINYINAGFSGGIGIDIPFSKVNMVVRADYKFGLVGFLIDGGNYLGYARLSFGIILHEKKKK